MKVAIWGAGEIGRMTAYRFATLEFVSEIAWINRSLESMEHRRIDLDHGLAFAPACRSVEVVTQPQAAEALKDAEILILTAGGSVPAGGTREQLYEENAKIIRDTICPALADFKGVVIVVSNPVELLCREIFKNSELSASRIIGLGTVVETARMQVCLRDYFLGTHSARDILAYAVGTHDERFVPVIPEYCFIGERLSSEVRAAARSMVKSAVTQAARRVKVDGMSTLHPIVEGVVAVARAIAHDSRAILSVSTLDPDDADQLFYSLPCAVGSSGVVARHTSLLEDKEVENELREAVEAMRGILKKS